MSASDVATLVKQSVDIVDVVSQVVALRRSGNRHVGLCPFHHEKTPSFHVDSENQFFHCFGCGAGGDVLTFVMRHQNLPFMDAVRLLADRYNIVLPQMEGRGEGAVSVLEAARREREELYRVLALACEFFHEQLRHESIGREARDYFERRGIPAQVVEAERLGYATSQWDGLTRWLQRRGVDSALGVSAGLLARSSKEGERIYDRFRHRVIFPIRDEQGRVVAFGGRTLAKDPQDEPKYLNSPETPVYHKGRMLYQLPRAREACRQNRQVILVEGYMDLLAFHAQGFYRVTATLGTALTSAQARLVARMADEIVLAYDGDAAGERAMLRALPIFLQEGLPVSCLLFPDGMDPDDFLRSRGLGAFEALMRDRRDLGSYAVGKMLDTWDGSLAGKARVMEELQPILEAVRKPVLKSEYVRLVTSRLALSERTVFSQIRQGEKTRSRPPSPARGGEGRSVHRTSQTESLEEKILRAILRYPELIEEVRSSVAREGFQEPSLRAIVQAVMSVPHPPDGTFHMAAVMDILPDPDLRELLARIAMEAPELTDVDVQLRDWLGMLTERLARSRSQELQEALQQSIRDGDQARTKEILMEIQRLSSTKRKVQGMAANDEGVRNR